MSSSKVPCIVRYQRDIVAHRAGGDPSVVRGDSSSYKLPLSHQPTVTSCNFMVVRNYDIITQGRFQVGSPLLSPLRLLSTEVEFSLGNKSD